MASNKITKQIIRDLEKLEKYVIEMFSKVDINLQESTKSFLIKDNKLAQKIAIADKDVNSMEIKIDNECNKIIAIRQPAARDLRFILSIIKIVHDLERIGDGTKKISHYATYLNDKDDANSIHTEIEVLAEKVIKMFTETLIAFKNMDYEKAIETISLDEKINKEFDRISRILISHMMEDPKNIKIMLTVNSTARTLERIGDHLKNICESIIYLVKGKDIRHTEFKNLKM